MAFKDKRDKSLFFAGFFKGKKSANSTNKNKKAKNKETVLLTQTKKITTAKENSFSQYVKDVSNAYDKEFIRQLKNGLSKEAAQNQAYYLYKDDIRAVEHGHISPLSMLDKYYKK